MALSEMSTKRSVPCDDAFWNAYANTSGYQWLDKEFSYCSNKLYQVVDFLFYTGCVRFTISLFSLLPYAACIAIGFSNKASSFGLRVFCWNGACINAIFTVFLAAKIVVEELVMPDDICYYDEANLPGTATMDYGPIGKFTCPFMIEDLNKWLVYATAITVTYVHFGTYRACTSPLSYSQSIGSWKASVVAVVVADILAAAIVSLESELYGPDLPYKVRTGIVIATAVSIWASELVVSSMSVFALVKWRVSWKFSKVVLAHNVNKSRMTSFLLFTIVPSLLLMPFVYVNLKEIIQAAREEENNECIEKLYTFSPYTLYAVAVQNKCGLLSEGIMNSLQDVLDAVAGVCLILCVWKPILEALSIIFLLPSYRAVALEKLLAFARRFARRNQRTVVFVVAPRSASRRSSVFTRSRHSA